MEKASICIYINNYGTNDIVLPDLRKANPGMGGSQYEMFLLCQLLQNKQIPFTLLLTHKQKFVDKIDYKLVKDIHDVFNFCNNNSVEYLVLRANDGLDCADELNDTKILYWIHNFIDYRSATKIAKNTKVEKVIVVSQEEADHYYDHDISNKGVVIFNSIPERRQIDTPSKENVVAFIGDLSPYKMFDKLTAMWPKIVKKIPDAKLLVLGSGDLYGKGKKIGQFGIAEESYEKKILKPILSNDLIDTVSFQGLVKGGMDGLISTAKVTVFTNPTETFCIAATDSIKNKVPVICPKSTGYCDVVTKKTGYLYRTKSQAIKRVVSILNNKKPIDIENDDLSYLNEFSSENFLKSWLSLFEDLRKGNKRKINHKSNLFVDGKLFIVLLKSLRRLFHLPNGFSRSGIRWYIKRLIKKN